LIVNTASKLLLYLCDILVDIRQLSATRQMLQDVIEEVPDYKQAKEILK